MLSMACLPIFGLDLVLFGRVGLETARVDDSNIHLFMVRSAAFATLATFAFNFLRRRRPLSSVAPLLFFCSWTLIFQPAFVLAYQDVTLQHIMFYLFTLVLVLILYRENKNEAKTIFVNEW
tara:strand:+ start:543 stop:905 length:363 start_codon:yes stop_codon:yes gene_type:complete